MASYDRNFINVRSWQQQIMDLHDKVDHLDRRSKTLATVVEILEERAHTWKVQIDETKNEAALVKLNKFHINAMKHLATYSSEAEECAIGLIVTKLSLESERAACALYMESIDAMHHEASEAAAMADAVGGEMPDQAQTVAQTVETVAQTVAGYGRVRAEMFLEERRCRQEAAAMGDAVGEE